MLHLVAAVASLLQTATWTVTQGADEQGNGVAAAAAAAPVHEVAAVAAAPVLQVGAVAAAAAVGAYLPATVAVQHLNAAVAVVHRGAAAASAAGVQKIGMAAGCCSHVPALKRACVELNSLRAVQGQMTLAVGCDHQCIGSVQQLSVSML